MDAGEKCVFKRRRGFSLMEILLATALLMGCVVVLTELATIGRHHIQKAEKLAAAELICQSAMNEILTGAAPVETVERRPVDGCPGWIISVEVLPLDKRPGLAALEIRVGEDLPENEKATEFTLVRWIPDPDMPDDTEEFSTGDEDASTTGDSSVSIGGESS
ncbi:MAG: hypothetical protein JXM70_10735 [Pirellulales bacterium]|nr:hypothetical protein [Pirellulales bacterium]